MEKQKMASSVPEKQCTSEMKSIRDCYVSGKRVLMRCDFNVPLDREGRISDDFRIQATLPTIEYILKKKGKLVLMTHLGRPEGKVIQRLKLDRVG